MDKLFKADVKTNSDRALLNICKATGVIYFSNQLIDRFLYKLPGFAQTIIITVVTLSAVTFIATLCILGIRFVGRRAGKESFLAQAWFVFTRVTLYIFLPCAAITLLVMGWVAVAN